MESLSNGSIGGLDQGLIGGGAGRARGESEGGLLGGDGVSLLDIISYKSPQKKPWNGKPKVPDGLYVQIRKKKLFRLFKGGFDSASVNSETIRFLTLTTSNESNEDIYASFEKFVKRVRRKFGHFEYAAVREWTVKGKPHLHVLFRGNYMDQKWISSAWSEVHSSFIVDIRKVTSLKKAANYLMKYLVKDGNCIEAYVECSDGVIRELREAKREGFVSRRGRSQGGNGSLRYFRAFSCSSGWIFKGYAKVWKLLIEWWKPHSGFYIDRKPDKRLNALLSSEKILPFGVVLTKMSELIAGNPVSIGDRHFRVSSGKLTEFVCS